MTVYRHPPLLHVTPTDHRAWIAIATVLGLCCALVTALLRVFVRTMISPPFGHDDTILLVATGFATIQSAVVVYGVAKGLGASEHLLSWGHLQALQQAAYASDILYFVSTYLSKCSVMFLLLRLTPNRRHRIAFNATLVGIVVLCVASIFAICLRCDLSHPWRLYHEKCTGLLLRWQVVTAFDVMTEAVIFGMSFYLIHGLHMSLSNKSTIVGIFAFRLVIIPFLVVRLISFPHHHLHTDPSFTLSYFYIWSQSTLYLSLMISTMPCLKPFVAGLNTGYGAFDTEHIATRVYGSTYGSNGNHRSGNYSQQKRRGSSRIKWGSQVASGKSKGSNQNTVRGPNSIVGGAAVGDGFRPQRHMVHNESGLENANSSKHRHQRQQPSQFDVGLGLDPRVDAGQEEERGRGDGKAMTYTTSAVAQDGNNSIGSDDSRQMIIRKDVTWAVEYSDPNLHGR